MAQIAVDQQHALTSFAGGEREALRQRRFAFAGDRGGDQNDFGGVVDVGHLNADADGAHHLGVARQRLGQQIAGRIQDFIVDLAVLVGEQRHGRQHWIAELIFKLARGGKTGIEHVQSDGAADAQQQADHCRPKLRRVPFWGMRPCWV